MAHIVLITGGCRSGKSAHAQKLAEEIAGRRIYIATCPVLDEEMRQRIERHVRQRTGRGWQTVEEQTRLAEAIASAKASEVVLVDCLTLWVNNLVYDAQQRGEQLSEEEVTVQCHAVLKACREHTGTIILVTNEVGMGIVPENALARRYRDLVGRCNQVMAAGADAVTLLACGIPLVLKGA